MSFCIYSSQPELKWGPLLSLDRGAQKTDPGLALKTLFFGNTQDDLSSGPRMCVSDLLSCRSFLDWISFYEQAPPRPPVYRVICALISWLILQLCEEAGNQELNISLPCGWQESSHLSLPASYQEGRVRSQGQELNSGTVRQGVGFLKQCLNHEAEQPSPKRLLNHTIRKLPTGHLAGAAAK